ncbi:MAG: DNA cytosine methyltransferase [Lentilitoribacter sp.]
MPFQKTYKIIDLFAGPGGLGEGFSQFKYKGKNVFEILVSIEKEKHAHATLRLRSFTRKFKQLPTEYYSYLKGNISLEKLYDTYPVEAALASSETWHLELGQAGESFNYVAKQVSDRIEDGHNRECIVIGGPPCQAYSLVGRSKMRGRDGFEDDPRHTLYIEYLKFIAEFEPAAFVMENVKGILSSKHKEKSVFAKILSDLSSPRTALNLKDTSEKNDLGYNVYSLSIAGDPDEISPKDYTIKSEEYGIPQARHRVVLFGVRSDIKILPDVLTKAKEKVSVEEVIGDLPMLRSGLSKENDTPQNWVAAIKSKFPSSKIQPNLMRGAEFIAHRVGPIAHSEWYVDPSLKGTLNHTTRAHIRGDLHRYYFATSYALEEGSSPKLSNLPTELLPNHKNVSEAIKGGSLFSDRFRVQVRDKPATTITSHISKDGHYFIHYDNRQCRSLTVREAARIQTFPDNYKFEGPRTSQYQQVGNAVPPLLANQIAAVVFDLLERNSSDT